MAEDFYLDTGHMDDVIKQVQGLAEATESFRQQFAQYLVRATANWQGKARNEFDVKAHTIMQQVTDITQTLYDVAEDLLTASTAYIQADTEAAKAIDGVSNRY